MADEMRNGQPPITPEKARRAERSDPDADAAAMLAAQEEIKRNLEERKAKMKAAGAPMTGKPSV